MPNDFQLDLFQLTPAEFRARYADGLKDYNDEDIHMMRSSASKPGVLLATGVLSAGTSSVGQSDTAAIVTHIILFPSWSAATMQSVTADTVPFSSSPTVTGAYIYVHGGSETRVDGNFTLVENVDIGGSDTCSVLFYGYKPATV